MASDYKAPIRSIGRLILTLLTQLAGMFTGRIKDMEVRLMAEGLLTAARETVEVLSDADPDDRDQLRAVINKLFQDGKFKQGAKTELLQQVAQLDSENIRVALGVLVNNAFPVAQILSDTDGSNTEQMRAYLRELVGSEQGVEFFNALLTIVLPPQTAQLLTLLLIQSLIEYLLTSPEQGAQVKAARMMELQAAYLQNLAAA